MKEAFYCSFSLLVQRKRTKRKDTLAWEFFAIWAKTALSAPRRYRSCPSELPTAILNRGRTKELYS